MAIFDEIDRKIIYEFANLKENEFFSSWELTKRIYKKANDTFNSKIKYKIEKMAKWGLFEVSGTPKVYTLDSDKVEIKNISFPDKRRKSICLKVDDKWEAFEI